MHTFINSPLQLGSLTLKNRLIQGPLAGYSCAPYRTSFNQFKPPAFCVSEMCSAADIIHKNPKNSRYLYRAEEESVLSYQISGTNPALMANAARALEHMGADLIDINCGCPKTKIRKKGAGSALLENPETLYALVATVRESIRIPLTVKIRIQGGERDIETAQLIAKAGADALIVHGRSWQDDYNTPCNLNQIASIKKALSIPVIANGDICDRGSLEQAFATSQCDAFMISRAGTGRPWLYQELLEATAITASFEERIGLFMQHLTGLARLEDEYKALLQSNSLVRYYFREHRSLLCVPAFYAQNTLRGVETYLQAINR